MEHLFFSYFMTF